MIQLIQDWARQNEKKKKKNEKKKIGTNWKIAMTFGHALFYFEN